MSSYPKLLTTLVALLMGALLPSLAFAQVVNPPGGTDWDMYVFGNGRVLFDVLNGVKMLMMPDAGNTGFTYLLLFLASAGFLTLAVAAGFDPGKNLGKMFSYILVVWLVTFSSTHIKANVVINDLAQNNALTGTTDYRVEGAPASVVLPAALTSEVGYYFTRSIETYMSLPGEFKLSGQAVGQFNLFGRMMAEAQQYVITSPELKRSLSAYTSDCVVSAMALGRLTGKTGPNSDIDVTGTDALLRTNNMWATLGTAANPAIMTTYYPMSPSDTTWMSQVSNAVSGLGLDPAATSAADAARYSSAGVVLDCASAYATLSLDLTNHAEALVGAGNAAWAKAGVMVPYETAMSTMLAGAAAPGSSAAGWSRPSGFILQTALVNSSSGAFRQAAMQTGNNELLQAAALAQAEQQQKSAWASGFAMFNNMTGYVYTVLQAFIFSLTPMIVIALMIPGMGKSIFVNYTQILVWLTLWQPTLAIVNFIIVLFGTESVSSTLYQDGGLSIANKALLSEKTNDLVIAAQFLGTMTPLITWGIVKGAMAFTEFITAGVGSNFAASAGAQAATGNMSLNNASMDNMSMGQYNTQMSSKVGFQAVSAGVNAGALSGNHDVGGNSATANGGGVTESRQFSEALSKRAAFQSQVSDSISSMKAENYSLSKLESVANDRSESHARREAASMVLAHARSSSTSAGVSNSDGVGSSSSKGTTNTGSISSGESGSVNVDGGLGIGGLRAGVGASASTNISSSASAADSHSTNTSADSKTSVTSGTSTGTSNSATSSQSTSTEHGVSNSATHRVASDQSSSLSAAYNAALSESRSLTNEFSRVATATSTMGYQGSTGVNSLAAAESNFSSTTQTFSNGLADGAASMGHVSGGIASGRSEVGAHSAGLTSTVDKLGSSFGAQARAGAGGGGGGVNAAIAGAEAQVGATAREVKRAGAAHQASAGTTVDALGTSRGGNSNTDKFVRKQVENLKGWVKKD